MSKSLKITIAIIVIFIGAICYMLIPEERVSVNVNSNNNNVITIEDLLRGGFIDNIDIQNNPLKLNGTIIISNEKFKNIIYTTINKYNIKEVNNSYISIYNDKIKAIFPYKVLDIINSQVEVYLIPAIKNDNLEVTIKDARLGKIKISDTILVNNIKKHEKNIPFIIDKNKIIISKDKMYPIILKDINIKKDNIFINVEVEAENIIDFINREGLKVK